MEVGSSFAREIYNRLSWILNESKNSILTGEIQRSLAVTKVWLQKEVSVWKTKNIKQREDGWTWLSQYF